MKITEMLAEATPIIDAIRVMDYRIVEVRAVNTDYVAVTVTAPSNPAWKRIRTTLPSILDGKILAINPVDGNYTIDRNGTTIAIKRSHSELCYITSIDHLTALRFVSGRSAVKEIRAVATDYGEMLVYVVPAKNSDDELFSPMWLQQRLITVYIDRP